MIAFPFYVPLMFPYLHLQICWLTSVHWAFRVMLDGAGAHWVSGTLSHTLLTLHRQRNVRLLKGKGLQLPFHHVISHSWAYLWREKQNIPVQPGNAGGQETNK